MNGDKRITVELEEYGEITACMSFLNNVVCLFFADAKEHEKQFPYMAEGLRRKAKIIYTALEQNGYYE